MNPDYYIKPAIAGGVAAVAFRQLFGNAEVSVMGRSTSLVLAGFAMGAAGVYVNELVSMYILPHISKDQRLRNFESLALSVGASAATFYFLPRFLIAGANTNSAQTTQSMMMAGVLSEIISQWLYESFFSGTNSVLML